MPKDYREFLLVYNGGYPEPDAFHFIGSEDGSTIDRFLGIGVGEHSNLEKYLKTYEGRLPCDFFPIAHDPGGNLICIGTKGQYKGQIFFWDHEYEADEEEPNMSNMSLVSQSFQELMDNLYELDI